MVDYTLEYYYQYYDIGGTLHKVELLLLEYSGGSTAIEHADPLPVRMRHTGSKTNFENTIIQGQELVFSFYVPRADVDTFDTLFESDYKDYKIRYYIGGDLEFEGYVKPENLSKSYIKNPPYIRISLSATDALADLKNIEFLDSNDRPITGRLTHLEILKHALTPIGIDFDFQIQLGTYESTYMVASDCVLEEIQIDGRRFFEGKGEFIARLGRRIYLSCWQVIEAVLKDYNVKFKQYKGQYQITCHHELNSHQFLYDWGTLTEQSRTVATNVLNITTYKFDALIEQQKVCPLAVAEVIFKNKDLGGDVTSLDLDDWGNDPPWTIDFSDGFAVDGGIVELKSDDDTYDENIVTAEFGVTKATDNDYLKVTFEHILDDAVAAAPPALPQVTAIEVEITITRPDATSKIDWFWCKLSWEPYESSISTTFKVIATGNYSVKLSFNKTGAEYTTANFKLKEFRVSKIINTAEDVYLSGVTYDQYYKQVSGKGIEVYKTETLLADSGQTTELGALLYEDSIWNNTATWRTYGHTEDIKLLDIYTRYILDNRYDYKNYLRGKIHDRDNNIGFDNVLTIDSKNYVFISYARDMRAGVITAELIQLLTTQQSYDGLNGIDLSSINGESINTSASVNLIISTTVPTHNDLTGLQGGQAGQYYHLTAAHHTDLTDGGNCSVHKHDDRYYTETEVNTWRNSVTQQEMGWLHGITSDVQTQITARAIIGANPADNRVCTWSSATTIQGETNLTFDGTILKQYSTEGGKTDWRFTIDTADADLTKIYNYDEGETAFRNMVLGNITNFLYLDLANTRIGIGTAVPDALFNLFSTTDKQFRITHSAPHYFEMGHRGFMNLVTTSDGNFYDFRRNDSSQMVIKADGKVGINDDTPSYQFDCNGIGRFTGNLYGDADVRHKDFITGWAGVNWRIEADGDAEFRNVKITGGLEVWELIINRLHYQCGGLIVGAGGGKVSAVAGPAGAEQVTFEDPEGNAILPFTAGAIVMIQDFDLDRTAVIKKIVRQVHNLEEAPAVDLTATAGWVPGGGNDDTGAIAVGDEMVAIGHISDTNLDASLYMSAVDSDNPFLRILDGVDSWAKFSLGDKTTIKVQIGNLASLANYDIVPAAPGFGLYSDNVYLSGKIVATSGSIGGWTIDSDAIYSNDKHAGDDWADESDPGITLMDDGSIHTPNFYVNTGGEMGLRQVESVLFKQGVGEGIKILSNHIWENELDTDAGSVKINFYGYGGGGTRYRDLRIYDGKAGGNLLMYLDGSADKTNIYTTTEFYANIVADNASGFAAYFFNDGNNSNRWGIGIQCGVDAAISTDQYPIRFYDGDGDLMASIWWDNENVGFTYHSDIKLKENIKDYDINGLAIISQMQYRSFNWKASPDKDRIVHGWVADEVESIYPEMVSVDPETGYKMIAESRLIPVMMAAIKELNEKVKILESK